MEEGKKLHPKGLIMGCRTSFETTILLALSLVLVGRCVLIYTAPAPSTTNGSHNRNSSTPVPQPASSPYSHVLQVSQHAQFSSYIFLNVESTNPSANSSYRWKIPEISSIVREEISKNHALPFIALTETWLKSRVMELG